MNAASRRTIVAVGACALGVAGALGWATVHALRLERRELEAQAQARFQESIRLALWRMDSALTPIVAGENRRPYLHYAAFYPRERAYTQELQDVPSELVPSPLLIADQQFVRLHFQRTATGELSSPQAPTGNFRDLAESEYVDSARVITADERLAEVGRILASGVHNGLLAGADLREQLKNVPLTEMNEVTALGVPGDAGEGRSVTRRVVTDPAPSSQLAQGLEQSQREYKARQENAGRAIQLGKESNVIDRQSASNSRKTGGVENAVEKDLKKRDAALSGSSDKTRMVDAAGETTRAPEALSAPAPVPAPAAVAARPAPGAAPDVLGKSRIEYRTTPAEGAALGETAGRDDELTLRAQANAGLDMDSAAGLPAIEQGDMAPVWRGISGPGEPQLLLLRSVRVGETRLEQGCWLDWTALKGWLVSSVQDLLPGATLRPVTDPYAQADPEALGRRLAGISAELEPGSVPVIAAPGWTPMRTTLVLTWGAVVLSFGAIGAALTAARELAERRGQFVSAVTHELRTPLTTFCLYSQMLADGMVTEESARRDYLGTLRRESERLARIVENVLEYARVGRSGGAPKRESLGVGALVERVRPSLAARAAHAGVVLDLPGELESTLASTGVDVDPVSVERILVNLVDNACKYAPGTPVKVSVHAVGRWVEIDIADQGPGISREQRARLFQPFERGRSLAHSATPGLGLGLALSRALARGMGGDLVLSEASPHGSMFTLRLPIRPGPPRP